NRIELGQIRAGMVVSCETAREINDVMIETMLQAPNMDVFTKSLATLTGGSGAVAVLVTDGSFTSEPRRRLLGGTMQAAPQYYGLCRWGLEGMLNALRQFTSTDSAAVLRYGVELGLRTWSAFLQRLGWATDTVDKVICHQVGASHRDTILKTLGIGGEGVFDLPLPRQHGHGVAA